jgi:2-oxoisovalerate dehydrogenase E1 component
VSTQKVKNAQVVKSQVAHANGRSENGHIEQRAHAPELLRSLYQSLVKPRLIEEKMLLLLRQGKITKWFSGIGQEAISVGAARALKNDEYILTLHRNLGVFTSRNIPLQRLFSQWQGNAGGFTKGRDRSFHFGTNEFHIVGMISHLGPQLCVADGIALASKLAGEKKVSMVFSGEGGTSEGDFHEALNVAAVWDLPVIFIIENNGYALSTVTEEQYRCERISDRAKGYGMEGITIDGNDLLTVYDTISHYAESLRERPRPVLIECMTFRMRGHEEASGTKYVPKELFEIWGKKDPIDRFEKQLIEKRVMTAAEIQEVRESLKKEINVEIEAALAEPAHVSTPEDELRDVYAPHDGSPCIPSPETPRTKKRFIDAVSDGLREGLKKHQDLVIMGQDVAEYGGVFKVTEGFAQEFGKERIRNTPLCESAILGSALGLSIKGRRSVVEMQFADFVSSGFNQIVNNFAKSYYRWGQSANVVVRMPTGAGSGAGPFHSQSNEAWFCHTAGLKVVYPAFPEDAKGLLLAALEDPNPVMYFEHKGLYRSVSGEVPEGYYTTDIGKARVVREGDGLSVITYGAGVHWALEYAEAHPQAGLHILDLRTLLPLDYAAIREATEKTGRVLILHEDTLFGGIGGEIAAWITECCFELLDAPIVRCASLDTPVPFNSSLEKDFLAKSRLAQAIAKLQRY